MTTRTYTVTAELEFQGEYARDVHWTITCDVALTSQQAITITRAMHPNFLVSAIEISEPRFDTGQFERTLDQALNEGDGTYKP
jgi:hypothetical protein